MAVLVLEAVNSKELDFSLVRVESLAREVYGSRPESSRYQLHKLHRVRGRPSNNNLWLVVEVEVEDGLVWQQGQGDEVSL